MIDAVKTEDHVNKMVTKPPRQSYIDDKSLIPLKSKKRVVFQGSATMDITDNSSDGNTYQSNYRTNTQRDSKQVNEILYKKLENETLISDFKCFRRKAAVYL